MILPRMDERALIRAAQITSPAKGPRHDYPHR
jgi:hypothetical protein